MAKNLNAWQDLSGCIYRCIVHCEYGKFIVNIFVSTVVFTDTVDAFRQTVDAFRRSIGFTIQKLVATIVQYYSTVCSHRMKSSEVRTYCTTT